MEKESRNGNAPVKWEGNGLQWHWWHCEVAPSRSEYLYYFYWWNWLPKNLRYVGFETMYYDGYHHSFGLWFINLSWNVEVPFLSRWLRARYNGE